MLTGLQASTQGVPVGRDRLAVMRANRLTVARIEAGPDPDAAAREVLDAGLRPFVICTTVDQARRLPAGVDAEWGNEPDIRGNGWTVERYVREGTEFLVVALERGLRPWVGAVSNLNDRGFNFLRQLPWSQLPPSVGCSFHRYPESRPDEGHDGRTRDEEVAELKSIIDARPIAMSEMGYNSLTFTRDQIVAAYAFEREFWTRHGCELAIAYQITDGRGTSVEDHYGFHTVEGEWKRDIVAAWSGHPFTEPGTTEPPKPPIERTYDIPVDITDGPVRISGRLTVRVQTAVAEPEEPEEPEEPKPQPVFDLSLVVQDASGRGIVGAKVTPFGTDLFAPEPRLTDGNGFVHFPVYGNTMFRLEAGGFATLEVVRGPGEKWPITMTRPVSAVERLEVEKSNDRWFRAGGERFDWREASAFGLYSRYLQGQVDEVRTYMRVMRSYGFTMLRVLFTLDGEYWAQLRCAPDMPGYWEKRHEFLAMAASEGLHIRATLLGALEPFGLRNYDWNRRPDVFTGDIQRRAEDFCVRFVSDLDDVENLVIEQANEPSQIGMKSSFGKLVALGRAVKAAAPHLLLCGGSPDGGGDQDVSFIRDPFDWCDAHIERLRGVGGFEWVKRSGEYMPIDQPADHWPGDQPRKPMPFVSGEPINFGEDRHDGVRGDVEKSPAVAFAYGGVSRARKFNACLHYDGGLWATLPKPDTVACIRAFMAALDAFPMLTAGKWRGHWMDSFFRRDIYPESDGPDVVEAHVGRGLGPWRVFGCGEFAITIAEPLNWNWQGALTQPADRLAYMHDGRYGSGVYRRR